MENSRQKRMSKSLHEEEKVTPSTFESLMYEGQNIIQDMGFSQQNKSNLSLFKTLTEYNQKKNEQVQNYVNAQLRLEECGFLKHIGNDHQGGMYYLIFGREYPSKDKDQKEQIKKDLFYIIDYIAAKQSVHILYFHTHISKLSKGPIKSLKKLYFTLEPYKQMKIKSFNVIHATFYLKTRIFVLRSCFNRDDIVNKVFLFSSLVSYLDQIKIDQSLTQKIIGVLPVDIHELYIHEVQQRKKKHSPNKKEIDYNELASIETEISRKSICKEVIGKCDDAYKEFNTECAVQYQEVMGRHLYEFKRSDNEDVPEVFVLLVKYFEEYPELLETEGIFRISGCSDMVEELQIHLSMGNNYYLTQLRFYPHVVACYLKKVLKMMGEPLCTFKLYSSFRNLSQVPKEDRVEYIKDICLQLPSLNRKTFAYLLRFFNEISDHSDTNKMTVHNLATILTPNIFRPFEITPNDLIYANQLVEVLKLMMQYYEYIFDLSD